MDPATKHPPVVGYHHLLHIGAQYAPEGDANISGEHEALHALMEGCRLALETGQAEVKASAADGAHYMLRIKCQEASFMLMELPPYSIRRGIVPVAWGQRELFERREAP